MCVLFVCWFLQVFTHVDDIFGGLNILWRRYGMPYTDGLPHRNTAFNAFCHASEASLHVQEAVKTLEDMKANGYRPTQVSYNAAMSALTKNGQWQQAIDMFGLVFRNSEAQSSSGGGGSSSDLKPDAFSYSAALSACAKGRKWQLAFTLFDEMHAAGVEPTEFHYSSLMTACERGMVPFVCVCVRERVCE